jgi:hypothetical protein
LCFKNKLILSGIHVIQRKDKQTVYSFQTLSLPYFTSLYNEWYKIVGGKRYKVLHLNIENQFTPLALAYFIMGDGS